MCMWLCKWQKWPSTFNRLVGVLFVKTVRHSVIYIIESKMCVVHVRCSIRIVYFISWSLQAIKEISYIWNEKCVKSTIFLILFTAKMAYWKRICEEKEIDNQINQFTESIKKFYWKIIEKFSFVTNKRPTNIGRCAKNWLLFWSIHASFVRFDCHAIITILYCY